VSTSLLNSYPASMVNFILFVDGKLLKLYYCSHKNHLKQLLSCICGDRLTFAADCGFQQDSAQHTEIARWLSF